MANPGTRMGRGVKLDGMGQVQAEGGVTHARITRYGGVRYS